MIHLFNNKPIFGITTRQSGPTGDYRAQEEQLPGVDGVRLYRLGRNPEVWRVRGRIVGLSLEDVRRLIGNGKIFVDGQVYNFTDSSGHIYNNCQLVSFNPTGDYEGIDLPNGTGGVTVEVDAVVRWIAPVAIAKGLG